MHVRLVRLVAVFAVAFFGAVGTVSGQEPQRSLSILGGTEALKVTGEEDSDTASAAIAIINASQSATPIEVDFQASSSDGITVGTPDPKVLPAQQARLVNVMFSGLADLEAPATGQLVVTGGKVPVARSVEVIPTLQPSANWSPIAIGGSFALAFLLMLGVIGNMPGNDKGPLANRAPGPKWSFSSWATTLTGLGAVLGIVLAQATFPSFPVEIGKQELVNLNVLFGILVVIAPFVFQALRKSGLSESDEQAGRIGTNGTLLLATSITLWAVLGQLATFSLLCWELLGRSTIAAFAIAGLVLLGALAIRYYLVTMTSMVVRDWGLAAEPAEATQVDLTGIDRLDVLAANIPFATLTRTPEEHRAEVAVIAPTEGSPPRAWPLL